MNLKSLTPKELHERAVGSARRFRENEIELISLLEEVRDRRLFLELGRPSIFEYACRELGLSEPQASYFLRVMRVAAVVPELKVAIQSGEITVSQARRIAPVLEIKKEEALVWIEKAAMLPQREIEKEVSMALPPELRRPAKARAIPGSRCRIEAELPLEALEDLRALQDLMSKSGKEHATIEDVLTEALKTLREKLDPVRKAERAIKREEKKKPQETSETNPTKLTHSPNLKVKGAASISSKTSSRTPIPASLLHLISLRDKNRCQKRDPHTGAQCSSTRYLHIHHVQPVEFGGEHSLENLTTLCDAHHRMIHEGGP